MEVTEGTVEEAAGETPQVSPPAPAPTSAPVDGVQKRIDELTRKRRDAERDAAYWRGQAEARTTSVAQETSSEPEEGQNLDPNDFNSDADYLRAVATQTRDEIKTAAAAEKAAEAVMAGQVATTKQYQEARIKHADFDEVALSPSVQVTQYMFDAAQGNSLGDILYHLGKNPDEASRIAALSATQQIKEIGRIETKLTIPITAGQTTTPNPPTMLGGGGGSPPVRQEGEMSRSELHAKWETDRRKAAGL